MNKDIYFVKKGKYFEENIVLNMRKKIYNIVKNIINIPDMKNILLLGITKDIEKSYSNYMEKRIIEEGSNVVLLSNQEVKWIENKYDNIELIIKDVNNINFEENKFELVFSNALIEHIGNYDKQLNFINNCYKISSKYAVIITPNKNHPIEFHSITFLLHLSPKAVFNKYLRLMKYNDLLNDNLNLLNKKHLLNMLKILNIKKYVFKYVHFLGFISNIILIIEKEKNDG